MNVRPHLSLQVHTSDLLTKSLALRKARRRQGRLVLCQLATLLLLLALIPIRANAAQRYEIPLAVGAGSALRVDATVDAPLDLTGFMGSILGDFDPASLQVVEVDSTGAVLDGAVAFQFDPAPGFDPAAHAAGTLVFAMSDTAAAFSTRHFRVRFDVAGACGDCPPPPVVANAVTIDSLVYENQPTYVVQTPAGDYYYHRNGAGLASLIDGAGNDWISFHDVPGSGSAGEYRGIPNLVFTVNNAAASFFHPGFNNATTSLISHGPLKTSIRSVTNNGADEWIVSWDFYRDLVRMTVDQVGTSNGGNYWFLYEGTPGGALDAGDVVVRADGSTTSAMDASGRWESPLPDPQWVYFRDTSSPRFLFISDDSGDSSPDSYRSMGPSIWTDPDMTVFGLGRVLDSSAGALTPRMSGTGRTFTVGLGENHTVAGERIAGARQPLVVTVGDPVDTSSGVGDDQVPQASLHRNFPNPFNPRTTIAFSLPSADHADLSIFDASGRLVRRLVSGRLPAGRHDFVWDGQDARGRMAASGVYLYRLRTSGAARHGKMTLLE